jgi:hypothetical protein
MQQGATINPLEMRPKGSSAPQLLVAVVLLAALGLAAWFALQPEREVPAEDWVTHTSEEGRFSLQFPREPEHSTREMEGSQGEVQMLTAELRSRVYAVAYNDYLENELNTFGADTLLDYAMQAGTEAIGGTITKSVELKWNDNPGREFWADVPGGKAHYRIYLAGLRLYRLAIIHAESFEANHEKFFESFALR